jgi:hypothetical protein
MMWKRLLPPLLLSVLSPTKSLTESTMIVQLESCLDCFLIKVSKLEWESIVESDLVLSDDVDNVVHWHRRRGGDCSNDQKREEQNAVSSNHSLSGDLSISGNDVGYKHRIIKGIHAKSIITGKSTWKLSKHLNRLITTANNRIIKDIETFISRLALRTVLVVTPLTQEWHWLRVTCERKTSFTRRQDSDVGKPN